MKTRPTDRLTPKTTRRPSDRPCPGREQWTPGGSLYWVPYAFALVLVVAFLVLVPLLSGCSTLAEYGERAVPSLFTPTKVALDQSHALLEYDYCPQDDVCVHRVSEFTRFEMTTQSGEVIDCLAIYQRFDWPDGSTNQWIWPSPEGDPRCEEEMERLAEPD